MPDRQKKKLCYSEKQATRWLSWLARGMQKHGQTVFLIEQLQPSWLTGRMQLAAYILASRIAIGMSLVVMVVAILVLLVLFAQEAMNKVAEGLFPVGRNVLIASLLSTSGVVLGFGAAILDLRRFRGGRIWARADKLAARWRVLAFVVIYYSGLTLFTYVLELPGLLLLNEGKASEDLLLLFGFFLLVVMPFFNLIGSLIWGSRAASLGRGSDISSVETLGWSWASARKGILHGFIKGSVILPLSLLNLFLAPWMLALLLMGALGAWFRLLVNAVVHADAGRAKAVRSGWKAGLGCGWLITLILAGIGIWLVGSVFRDVPELAFTAGVALALFGLCGGVIGCIFGGLQSRVVAIKNLPNQGIRLSLKNALIGGCLIALPFGLLGASAGLWVTRELSGFFVGVVAALVAGYFGAVQYGGVDCVYHFVLRLILFARGALPFHLSRFLDYAVDELHFLQKVGGGYMFIHRYLQEHFAALRDEGESEAEQAAKPVTPLAAAG